MPLADYVKKDTIYLKCQARNRGELFSQVTEDLLSKKYVKKGFLDFINNREDKYPTGLQFKDYTVAIPHGDPKYINKPFIAVITLLKPILMRQMDDVTKTLYVDTLFILGLSNGTDHLSILQEIMKLLQKGSFVKKIRACNSKDEVEFIIKNAEKALKGEIYEQEN